MLAHMGAEKCAAAKGLNITSHILYFKFHPKIGQNKPNVLKEAFRKKRKLLSIRSNKSALPEELKNRPK